MTRVKSKTAVSKELAELGLVLPQPVTPLGNYLPAVWTGEFVFFSGHGPLRVGNKPAFVGHVGADFSNERASTILIGATLNLLSSAEKILGDLDRVDRVIEAHVIVACANDDVDLELVSAPAFQLLTRLFGPIESTRVTRAVSLPNGVPVLVEMVVTAKELTIEMIGWLPGT